MISGWQAHTQPGFRPRWVTRDEAASAKWDNFTRTLLDEPVGFETPPPQPVRAMAEWEELQALAITWTQFPQILREIVRHAKEEVTVLIIVKDAAEEASAINYLQAGNVTLDNVEFIHAPYNRIWMRDYGPNCVYANNVEDLYFIDWIYNRINRPLDNLIPGVIGDYLNIPVYQTTEAPDDLVHTGGNYMSDGLGTAFSSNLILEENAPGNEFDAGPHDEAAINAIMKSYMGIERYIKMEKLPYDVIHHIDMHMKLLDEETILMGEYPVGIADGPQIEANLEYVTSHFKSTYDTPYRVVRILQPPDGNQYPNNGGDYRTYTNSVFVNKTILVPTYEQKYDTTALRIYRENFPGYKVVGINCNAMIGSLGALHCITKEVGVHDPLRIVHQRHRDVLDNDQHGDYEINARIEHRTGIASALVYFTTDTLSGYSFLPMTLTDSVANEYTAYLPHQPNGEHIYYYIQATANSGKNQVRPLPAPAGYYRFRVDGVSAAGETATASLSAIYPNPASAMTVIPVRSKTRQEAVLSVSDVWGKTIETVFSGQIPAGESKHFLDADRFTPGAYFVKLQTNTGVLTQKLIVK